MTPTSNSPEALEPCPFCDGEGWLHHVPGGAIWPCWKHNADCPVHHDAPHYLTKADAIAAGNRRAQITALSERLAVAERAQGKRDKVLGVMADALDEADALIDIHIGVDTPSSWNRTFRRVVKARAALTDADRHG